MKALGILAVAAIATTTPAPSPGASPYRAQWGILADMAGRDYYYTSKGWAYGAVRMEWIAPGRELHLVEMYSAKAVKDCRLALVAGATLPTGTCVTGNKKPERIEALIDADGNVAIASVAKDMLFGDQRMKWGRFRPGKAPGTFELRVAGIESRPVLRTDDPTVKIPPYASWLPDALSRLPRIVSAPPVAPPVGRPAAPDKPPV